ncbi:AraC family transcriptional regulator [Orrella sp. JC864]|uniref:AraC family transcriptional regulator n=1 Tax=Orrella sp. JC864 TaxID=3120298 RepID=UPI00300B59E1
MSDRLEALLDRYSVSAQVFHTGALCGANEVPAAPGSGHLHLLRAGTLEVAHGDGVLRRIDEPSLLLYPAGMPHRFVTDARHGADLACAYLRFEDGAANPIAAALPEFCCVPLREIDGAPGVLALLFEEAASHRCGRRAMLDRLFEVVLIQLLRHLMEGGAVQGGMLAGMAHPRLRHALVALHQDPARPWTLQAMASQAGMSRSVFANVFRATVGCTPAAYLQSWRLGLARQALRRGRALKLIAAEMGYGSEAALSRAFKAQGGLAPRQWRQAHGEDAAPA